MNTPSSPRDEPDAETGTRQDRLIIFDTTLRDGEQSPGAAMTQEDKIRIARQLDRLGVDVIEAGFAAASPGDAEVIRAIAQQVRRPVICSLSRCNERDVRAAGESLRNAERGRVHVFLSTSPLHMAKKLRMTPEAVFEAAIAGVKLARQFTDDVEFSAEDATRSDPEFLCRLFDAVIAAGATTINVPDTVGYATPEESFAMFQRLIEQVAHSDRVIWSAHCHDDLGMGVANSLAAIRAGVRQVECTINGIGERAGNASLEEIVMAVRTRADFYRLSVGIDAPQIVPTSKLVSAITGYPVQPNKAIVGANAFVHESGIHQDGVLKHRETYEIMSAESVGWNHNKLTLGKLSGRNALRNRLEELGIAPEGEEALNAVFARFKNLADKKREIFDEDLLALVGKEGEASAGARYRLIALKVHTETGETPQAELTLSDQGTERRATATGSGPVDAVFRAIESLARSETELQLYSVNAITEGTDSQGEVTVRLAKGGQVIDGHGADTDILVASSLAYLSALNRFYGQTQRQHPQHTGA